MTNESGRTLSLPLGFLKRGAYRLEEYADGPDAATKPEQISATDRTVRTGETLTLTLAPSGGYAARLSPAKLAK
jgi:alpha-glucosidase